MRVSKIIQPLRSQWPDSEDALCSYPWGNIEVVAVEIVDCHGQIGTGFSYAPKPSCSALYALVRAMASDLHGFSTENVEDVWTFLSNHPLSLNSNSMTNQALACFDTALWDLKARQAGLPLAELIGAYRRGVRVYSSRGQSLKANIDQMQAAAKASVAKGIDGIKIEVGQPDWRADVRRIESVRDAVGPNIALMIDARRQWCRERAYAFCTQVDDLGLAFIEEPLNATDKECYGALADALDTPIATGAMATSIAEHERLMHTGVGTTQAVVARVGGVTPYLQIMELAKRRRTALAPGCLMEQHIQMLAIYPIGGWIQHFDCLDDLFNEGLDLRDGRIWVPDRPGFGLTFSDKARERTHTTTTIGAIPQVH
nr:mandelate racemase/muconate lactonizing enzyme family protein [Notoacmeibacter sp. MSK16QG-6]